MARSDDLDYSAARMRLRADTGLEPEEVQAIDLGLLEQVAAILAWRRPPDDGEPDELPVEPEMDPTEHDPITPVAPKLELIRMLAAFERKEGWAFFGGLPIRREGASVYRMLDRSLRFWYGAPPEDAPPRLDPWAERYLQQLHKRGG